MDVKEIQEQIKAADIDSLRIDFTDLHGVCRSKLVPARRLEAMLEEGLHHAQATYALDLSNNVAMGTGVGDEVEWRDMVIRPDLNTFAVLPHMEKTARLIGNAYREDGSPHPVDPRNVLLKVIKKYEEKGLRPVCASELEFFMFNQAEGGEPQYYNPGLSCVYQVNPIIDRQGILRLLQNTFLELGLEIIYLNSEFFPGQFEVNWKYDHALAMADQTFTFKYVCKEESRRATCTDSRARDSLTLVVLRTEAPSREICDISIGSSAQEHGGHGTGEKLEVEPYATVLEVLDVHLHLLGERDVGAPADLPDAGETWLPLQATTVLDRIAHDLARNRWPRSNERHFPFENIEEIWEFIK